MKWYERLRASRNLIMARIRTGYHSTPYGKSGHVQEKLSLGH